jgi:CRISPR-associated endonuclease/helicase Cas3
MKLYDYQIKVARLLRRDKSVILQAPTGAGKTIAALWPYLETWDRNQPSVFPRKCIYSVPVRVLANQFLHQTQKLIEEKLLLVELPDVTIQTGEQPEDPRLEGNLIFSTIDQTLSSFFNVPYALSQKMANLNAGAIIASYLVFDEFHLFPYDSHGKGALPATLQLLQLLRHTTPFVLMTATFSEKMLDNLASFLDAEVVKVPADELVEIDTRRGELPPRQRFLHTCRGRLLLAADVMALHQTRSLAICNTVDRATALFQEVLAAGSNSIPFDHPYLVNYYEKVERATGLEKRQEAIHRALQAIYDLIQATPGWNSIHWAMLLHARFERRHRAVKEELARQLFGPEEERPLSLPSLILVATQVIEVGLNLTNENLHTEIAPANSVLQRAGRCGRFPGETGHVYVYDVPLDKREKPNYAPYPAEICELTWKALEKRDGQKVGFTIEQKIVNEAHGPGDEAMWVTMQQTSGDLWEDIVRALADNDASVRSKLIRQIDSRTLIVYEPPSRLTEESPYTLTGFSIYHGSLRSRLTELQEWAQQLDLDWALQYPVPREGDEPDRAVPITYEWVPVNTESDIGSSLLFTVHPALVAYDAVRGFRFVAPNGQGNQYCSTAIATRKGRIWQPHTYQLESYTTHIGNMIKLYEQDLLAEMAYVARRLEEHPLLILPSGGLDRATRLAIALHDVGKLQRSWQEWAAEYQKDINDIVPDYLVAHTLNRTEEHQKVNDRLKHKRPYHAGESAIASEKILLKGLWGNRDLVKATLSAIARHHSPQISFNHKKWQGLIMHHAAVATVAEALSRAVCDQELAEYLRLERKAPPLNNKMLQREAWEWWLVYFLIVRALRLTDGKSLETSRIL